MSEAEKGPLPAMGQEMAAFMESIRAIPPLPREQQSRLARLYRASREFHVAAERIITSSDYQADIDDVAGQLGLSGAREYYGVLKEGHRARSILLRCNARLIASVAAKYQRLGVPLEDLLQAGITVRQGTRGWLTQSPWVLCVWAWLGCRWGGYGRKAHRVAALC